MTTATTQPTGTAPTEAVRTGATVGQTIAAMVRRPGAVAGMVVLTAVLVLAAAGPLLAPYGPNDVDINHMLEGPGAAHWFGTDELGRDVLSRVILGARASLEVSAVSIGIALVVGVLLGLVAGYYGRAVDAVIMSGMDVLFAFPALLLAIALVAVVGPGTGGTMAALAVVYTPVFARVTRARVLSVRQEPYVQASVSIGSSDRSIILGHILPNVAAPVIVQTSLALGFAILAEAGLSFLGLGVQPPQPSWGRMLFDARGFVQQAWWMSVFPGLAILLTVLSFNLIGDALRDVLDPRSRSRLDARSR